jgi:hypothetical protein
VSTYSIRLKTEFRGASMGFIVVRSRWSMKLDIRVSNRCRRLPVTSARKPLAAITRITLRLKAFDLKAEDTAVIDGSLVRR